MTTICEQAPAGSFDRLEGSRTLAEIANKLAAEKELCLTPCTLSDARFIEMVSEPYGYDVVFVPEFETSPRGQLFLKRRCCEMSEG